MLYLTNYGTSEDIPTCNLESLEKLKNAFDSVLDYNGDDELISNMNSEYTFDPDDVICTDGFIIQSMRNENNINNGKSTGMVSCETAIRGATYLIVSSKISSNIRRYHLYINVGFIDAKTDEVIKRLEKLKYNISDSIDYYINDWVGGDCLPNPFVLN